MLIRTCILFRFLSATQGLGGLLSRLQAVAAAGACFSKWHALILSNLLSYCAVISQQAGLAIVEPDVDFVEDVDFRKSIGST